MPDEVQKMFVRSFVGFLKKQVDSQSLTPDSQESVEVAIQCLQAAFDVGDEDDSQGTAAAPAADTAASLPRNIDLFELFQSMYIERNPDTLQMADSIKNEGNRLMKDGKYNEALLQYNRAVAFDPKNPIYYCNRAAAYIRLGDNDKAITDCKSALVYNPGYGKAYGRLGIAYSNLGKYEEAQQAYTKAIELEPENQDYRNNLEIARNARNYVPENVIPNLSASLNTMLGNPSIRNLFSSAEIDLEQLQQMSQNPMVLNAIGQLMSGMQTGGGGGAGAPAAGGAGGTPPQIPPMPNDLLQLFQSFASQLSQTGAGGQGGGTANPNQGGQDPPPPPAL